LPAGDYPARGGLCNQKRRVCGQTHSFQRRRVGGK
jgi:hypothetical protein